MELALSFASPLTFIKRGDSRGNSKLLRGVVKIAQMARKATVVGTGAKALNGDTDSCGLTE
jgi:hypothetical protein